VKYADDRNTGMFTSAPDARFHVSPSIDQQAENRVMQFLSGIKEYVSKPEGEVIEEVTEKYGFWSRWLGTLNNLARNNLAAWPFDHNAKEMRMDQDETFAKTKAAVDAFNSVSRGERKQLGRALLDGTLWKGPATGGMGIVWDEQYVSDTYGLSDEGVKA
jgi:hypothetical protein